MGVDQKKERVQYNREFSNRHSVQQKDMIFRQTQWDASYRAQQLAHNDLPTTIHNMTRLDFLNRISNMMKSSRLTITEALTTSKESFENQDINHYRTDKDLVFRIIMYVRAYQCELKNDKVTCDALTIMMNGIIDSFELKTRFQTSQVDVDP